MKASLSGKLTVVIFVLITLALTIPRLLFHQGAIGGWIAIISTSSALLILGIWVGRRSWNLMPSDAGAESEQTQQLAFPFEAVCKAIPSVVGKNHWEMLETDERDGRFKAKIGFSFWTISQTMMIQVCGIESKLTKVQVRCKAYRQSTDYGQNNRMIAKFYHKLEKSLVPN